MYYVKLILLFVVSALALPGCSTMFGDGDVEVRATVAGANLELAKAQAQQLQTPLVQIEFNDDGQITHLELGRPDVGSMNYVTAPDDPRLRVYGELVSAARSVLGIAAGAFGAGHIVSETGKVVEKTLRYQPQPVVVQPPPYNDPVVVQPPPYNDPIVVQPPPYNDPIVVQPPPYNDPVIVEQPPPVQIPPPEVVIIGD